MKIKYVFAALLLAPALAAGDPVPENAPAKPADKVCLRHDMVDGWGSRDNHSMIVNDRFGKKYLVSLRGLCNDLPFAFGMGFDPPGRAPTFGTCVDRGDRLVMRGGGASRMSNGTCWVDKVQLYTKEMEAADKTARAAKEALPVF